MQLCSGTHLLHPYATSWEQMHSTSLPSADRAIISCAWYRGSLKKRPYAVQSFVSSLIAAEEFLKNHEDEAKIIVMEKLGLKISAPRG